MDRVLSEKVQMRSGLVRELGVAAGRAAPLGGKLAQGEHNVFLKILEESHMDVRVGLPWQVQKSKAMEK